MILIIIINQIIESFGNNFVLFIFSSLVTFPDIQEFDDDYVVKSHTFVKCESMSPLRLMDSEQETNQRICTDDQAKAYNSDCNEIIDETVAIKEMARDDANSNILKRISEQQTQVMATFRQNKTYSY